MANFPGAAPGLAINKADATTTPTDHPGHHNAMADEINAIADELGYAAGGPSASFSSVENRLNARLTCRKTADQTISSTVALTDVADLTLPINTIGIDYWFKFAVVCTSSAGATNGIRIGLTCPALTGYVSAMVIIPRTIDANPAAGTAASSMVVAQAPWVGHITSSGDSVVSDIVSVGINFIVHVEGVLSAPSATGSIQLQAANEVTTVNGNVIKRGSWGEVYIS